jgi:sugar/nucleoside kinase (ribokinase family)
LSPDFVVAGHLTCDERPGGGPALGGTAAYAAIAARNIGYRAAILTRAADDFPQPGLLRDIALSRLPSDRTTTFRNLYAAAGRRQYIAAVAESIDADRLPESWRSPRVALLGPIAREVDAALARRFDSQTLLGVTPQGWLRRWDESGLVHARAWIEALEILPLVRVLVLSEEDLSQYAERLQAYTSLTPVVVLTRGPRGCTVYERGRAPFDSPAFRVREVDPTGAGDVFAASFLIRLHETGDLAQAARFANCAASFVVEAESTLGIPTRDQIEKRIN